LVVLEPREPPNRRIDHTEALGDAIIDRAFTTATDCPVTARDENGSKQQAVFNALG
jgi:hypothetical protein